MYPGPDDPLRIAYLSYRGKPHVGGQGVYTRHLTKALVDLGHHVEVLGGQPYPVLDERVPLTKLPSLDIFNDHYPGRFPAYWEIRHLGDVVEIAPVLDRDLQRAPGLQRAGLAGPEAPAAATSTSSTTTRASATACWPSSGSCRRSSRCTTPSPWTGALEMAHAPDRRKRGQRRPLVLASSRCRPGWPARCPASSW